jgi:AcrR family transcriptional regulator
VTKTSSATQDSRPKVADTANSPAPARGARWGLVEAQILEEATGLFAARGFAGTSMQDIANAAGLTRSALYHYFANKEEVLSRLVSELTAAPAGELAKIRQRTSLDAAEKLRAMAYVVAYQQASQPDRFKVLIRSESELPESLLKAYADGRRLVLKEFTAVIENGMRSGIFRTLDARVAALGVIGLCNWVAWWHHPAGEVADGAVAQALADMAVASLVHAEQGNRDTPVGVSDALALLKQDISTLERVLGAS